jgi:hypothetical protein
MHDAFETLLKWGIKTALLLATYLTKASIIETAFEN